MPVVPPKGKAALERPTGRTSAEVVADGGTLACDPAVVCEGGIFGTLVVWDLGGIGLRWLWCGGFGWAGAGGLVGVSVGPAALPVGALFGLAGGGSVWACGWFLAVGCSPVRRDRWRGFGGRWVTAASTCGGSPWCLALSSSAGFAGDRGGAVVLVLRALGSASVAAPAAALALVLAPRRRRAAAAAPAAAVGLVGGGFWGALLRGCSPFFV